MEAVSDIDHTYWYLTRASGFVAYLLLFTCVSLGLSMTGNTLERWLARYRVYDLHRFLSLVTLGVTGFHILIVLPDAFIGFSLAELVVPFVSPYRPAFMAFGLFSFYLVVILVASFYLLSLLSYRVWRWLHYGAFAAFLLAFGHGIGAGTDSEGVWAVAIYAVTGLSVFGLVLRRVLRGSARGIPIRPVAVDGPVATHFSL